MDRRGLLAVLQRTPPQAPLLPNDAGTALLEKLLYHPAHEVYAKGARPMEERAAEQTHDIRVGARRLFEALELAEPILEGRRVHKAQRRARQLRRAFGDKRIADVLMEDLRALLKEGGIPEPAGLAHLVAEGDRGLSDALRAYPPERLLGHGLDVLELTVAPRRPELTLTDLAGRHLYRRAAEVEPLVPTMNDPRALEDHHRLRIRIKRLRYALEILAAPYEATLSARPLLTTLRSHQALLGRLNDAKDLVLWLHDPELVEVLHPELAAELIVRARRHVELRWQEAQAAVSQELPPLLEQLRRIAGALDDHGQKGAPAA